MKVEAAAVSGLPGSGSHAYSYLYVQVRTCLGTCTCVRGTGRGCLVSYMGEVTELREWDKGTGWGAVTGGTLLNSPGLQMKLPRRAESARTAPTCISLVKVPILLPNIPYTVAIDLTFLLHCL